MKKQFFIEVICSLFILLFVYAALMKGIDMEKFRVQLDQSPLLMAFAEWIVWLVPFLELAIVVMLVIPQTKLAGLYAAFTLMAMFTSYIIVILNFASHIPCSCGGILDKMGWNAHLVFNIGFTALSVIGIVLITSEKDTDKNPISTKI